MLNECEAFFGYETAAMSLTISSILGKSVIDEGCTAFGEPGLCTPSVFFISNFGFVKEHFSVVCRYPAAMLATAIEKGNIEFKELKPIVIWHFTFFMIREISP